MSLYFYFYLIHFLADYPFQSSSLVKYKSEHFLGVVIHSTIHLITLLVVLTPFLPDNKVWAVIFIIYITHILIDQTKVMLNRAYPKYIRFFYFLDQAVHLVIVSACAWYLGAMQPQHLSGPALQLYRDPSVVQYLLILVLVTYFFDVTRYFVKQGYEKGPFKRDFKGMIRNAVIVTLAFAVYWLAY